MNNFFTDNFNISNIALCILVEKGGGQKIHKNRPTHGLVLLLNGSTEYIFDGKRSFIVNAGDVFYLPKFSNYQVHVLEAGDCIAVNFDLYERNLSYDFFSLTPSQYLKFEKNFYSILHTWNLSKPGYLNTCHAILYGLIADIQQEAAKVYVPSAAKKLIMDAVDYIQEHISCSDLTVQMISDHLNISPEYFRKLFKNVYHISPRQYIIEIRMRKAQQLIASGEFSIRTVSQMCGYDSESYFSKEFKRICGHSPTDKNTQDFSV